jgi:hypothetical protein
LRSNPKITGRPAKPAIDPAEEMWLYLPIGADGMPA